MRLETIQKTVKAVAVVLVAMSSTVFQANGCSINVSGLDKVLDGLVDTTGLQGGLGLSESSFWSGSPSSSYDEDFGDCGCWDSSDSGF